MGRTRLATGVCLGVCVLVVLANQGPGQGKKDPYAEPNRGLELLLLNVRGIKVKMEGPINGKVIPPKGLKAVYSGSFKTGNKEWEVWRYARPQYGDILEVGWLDSDGDLRRVGYVECPKNGIRQQDVMALFKDVGR
jgi:hypothetical protein